MLSQPRSTIESCVLADLIRWPKTHAWELAGLTPDLFADPRLRAVAEGLCRLRDSGRKLGPVNTVRLLRKAMRPKGLEEFTKLLARDAMTTHGSMTVYVSQLHWYAARKGKAA